MPAILNQRYSRKQISEMYGGSIQSYLPFRDGCVTCGCFRAEERYNPNAPEEVMFGCDVPMPDVERAAQMVFEQGQRGEAIPIFIYHKPTQWEYVGDYLCVALEHDPILLRQKILAYPRRVAIAGLLRFKKV